jgi:hypothetical protein
MERMYRLCKESLWIRSELSENCFHSVVKIILINYAKKTKLIHAWSQLERKIPRVPENHFIYAASSQFSSWRVVIITDTIVSPVINLATFWIYVTHDNKLWIKSKKFTSIFNNKFKCLNFASVFLRSYK